MEQAPAPAGAWSPRLWRADVAYPSGADPGAVAPGLAGELRLLAGWLDLEHVSVATRGDLAGKSATAVVGDPTMAVDASREFDVNRSV